MGVVGGILVGIDRCKNNPDTCSTEAPNPDIHLYSIM